MLNLLLARLDTKHRCIDALNRVAVDGPAKGYQRADSGFPCPPGHHRPRTKFHAQPTLFGPLVIRSYPYEKMYFLPLAREFRRALSLPLVLLGGIKDRADIEAGLAEGFDAVAMARALLHDPALIAKYQSGSQMQSSCIPCNGCVAEMERPGGVRCVRT